MGISWVKPFNVKDVLVAWRRRLKKGWVHGIWKLIRLAIWWCTWKERNRRIFEGKSYLFRISSSLFWVCCTFGAMWSMGVST